jgi:outer membrane lipoprotein-sorting protein
MIQRISLLIIALFAFFMAEAQSDKKAKDVLDKLSASTKSYKTYKVSFNFSMENKDQKISENKEGSLQVKGNKYYLKLDAQEIFCDGKNIYTYSKDNNEAQFQTIDDLDDESITPQNIFTIYEKGFKNKYNREDKTSGKLIHVIDLFPVDPKKKEYSIIRLFIDDAKMQVTKAAITGKNGSNYTYTIKKLEPNVDMADNVFVFDKAKFPGVKVIK